MGNSGVGVKVVMARNRSGTSERRVGTRSQAQNNQQNNGEATPVVEIEENVLASTTSLVSTTSTSSSTSVESLISPVVPSELAHIPKKLLDEFLHECFFGVIQEKRRGENNVDRVYKCKDCSFSMNVGDADVRKHTVCRTSRMHTRIITCLIYWSLYVVDMESLLETLWQKLH